MIGGSLGSYVVTSQLGKGAMGEVWEARHKTLGRRVAIKVLRGEHAENRDSVDRFFNEARAASAVEHHGIVEVLDFGHDAEGRAFLVMEYLDGESLGRRLRRTGPVAPEVAIRIARQIAGALGAAHARGIVHRDLKPDNVFLVRDPEVAGGERAKIVDFGIAKLADPELRGAVETHTGAIVGTPAYMAPEQCRGAGAVDRRADLYALGCILFDLLTGSPPFVRAGLGDLLAAHMFDPPPALLERAPAVPAELAAVIERLLAKRPEDRYASAAELLAALDGEPAPAPAREISPAGREEAPDALRETLASGAEAPATTSTLGGAAAEASPVRAHGGRGRVLVAGAVVAAAALVVALLVFRGDRGTPPAPPAEAPARAVEPDLAPLRAAIAASRWTDAVTAAAVVLDAHPDHAEAIGLRDRAVMELSNGSLYASLQQAAIDGDPAAMVAAFRSMSAESAVYGLASMIYERHRGELIADRRAEAERASIDGDCARIDLLVTEVRALFPDGGDPIEQTANECRARPPAPAKRRRPPPAGAKTPPASHVEIGEAETTVGVSPSHARKRGVATSNRWRTCADALEPGTAGRIEVTIVVSATGTVSSATATGELAGNAELVACLERVARTMQFPAPEGGGTSTIRYPLRFEL